MTSKLGCHWIRVHPDNRDIAHVEKMQYKSVKLFEWSHSDADFCADLLAVLPKDAYILARNHPLSEQKQEMWDDPAGTGTYHANQWAMKVATGNVHTPVERTFFLGINEPDATSGDRNAIDIYTEAFLDRLRVHGLRGGAFNFSTGHPRTVDGSSRTLADYAVFERSHQAISRGHHIGVLHIYGTAAVPCAPGHYDRLRACPWMDVEWVVGEAGIDQHVIGGGPHDGYLRALGNPADYCRWIDEFIMGINDKRIHSYQVFTYDFSHPWDSFDTRPIRDALESYDWQHTKQPPIAIVGDGPTPGSPLGPKPVPTTLWIRVIAVNLRSGPSTDNDIVRELPQGTSLAVTGATPARDWYQVRTGNDSGWVYASLTSTTPVAVPPVPAPVTQDHRLEAEDKRENWERSWPIVLKFEGGLSLDLNDTGNYYQGKLIGTKFGISAAVWGGQYDIPNLTQEQALNIYKQHYFDAVGAAALAWPLCLAVFDHAVNAGVGSAKQLLGQSGPNFLAFMAERITWYTHLSQFNLYGGAWMRRMADVLREGAK